MTPSTRNLISTQEFALMRRDCVLVNVGRGGLVNEDALIKALAERKIFGAATDVFVNEPAGSDTDSPLLGEGVRSGELNLTLTPHLAWCADQTLLNARRITGENIEGFVSGEMKNVVI
jgi:lactate dehydrogenase-like 2-hydroxyacid dehydrogenase